MNLGVSAVSELPVSTLPSAAVTPRNPRRIVVQEAPLPRKPLPTKGRFTKVYGRPSSNPPVRPPKVVRFVSTTRAQRVRYQTGEVRLGRPVRITAPPFPPGVTGLIVIHRGMRRSASGSRGIIHRGAGRNLKVD